MMLGEGACCAVPQDGPDDGDRAGVRPVAATAAVPLWYPPAVRRPVANQSPGLIHPTRGFIPHVQVGNGSLFGWFDNPASRASSHLWLSKDGQWEQYVSFDRKAWAQAAGNPYWISCECEGFPGQDYTAVQIQRLGEFYAWGMTEFGWQAEITDSVNGYGIGTHRMGGAAWGGHSCPGELRARRRGEILARARVILAGPAPAMDVDQVAAAVAARIAGDMRSLVTRDEDGREVRMEDVRIATAGEAIGLVVLRTSEITRRLEELQTLVALVLAGAAGAGRLPDDRDEYADAVRVLLRGIPDPAVLSGLAYVATAEASRRRKDASGADDPNVA